MAVVQNIIVFVLSLGILVLLHELGHFIFARLFGVKVNRFSIGFGPVLGVIGRDKTTEYVISAIPLGGYVDLSGERPDTATGADYEFMSKPIWQRALIVSAGPLMNFLVGFVLFWIVYATGAPEQLPYVGSVSENMPAQEAGILAGDRIVSIDGKAFDLWDDMAKYVHQHPGKELTVVLERKDRRLIVKLTPKLSEIPGLFGETKKVGLMGITPDLEKVHDVRFGFSKGFVIAGRKVIDNTQRTVQALFLLFTGNRQVIKSIAGPIGIYKVTAVAWKVGFNVLLMIMGMLSISLAVFNLLPIPILDGGHLLFLSIEAVLRRPVPEKVQEAMYNIGFGLLMLLLTVVMFNDIKKVFFKKQGAVVNEEAQEQDSKAGQR